MRHSESASILVTTLAIGTLLFIAGGIGFSLALRANRIPPFALQLTVDGRNALVIHTDRPCTPDVRISHTCKDGALLRRTFQIIVSTPRDTHVLVSINLPAR